MYGKIFVNNGIPFILQRTLIAPSLGCLEILSTSIERSVIQLRTMNLKPAI